MRIESNILHSANRRTRALNATYDVRSEGNILHRYYDCNMERGLEHEFASIQDRLRLVDQLSPLIIRDLIVHNYVHI